MLSNKFKINKIDKYLYVKNTYKGYVIVYLYIDDMLFLRKYQLNKFDIKDLNVTDVIQRIKISRTSDRLILSPSLYLKKVIDKFSKDDNSVVKTPMDISVHLSKNKGEGIY
jgi:hypothetical protein